MLWPFIMAIICVAKDLVSDLFLLSFRTKTSFSVWKESRKRSNSKTPVFFA